MKIVICDDEKFFRDYVSAELEKYYGALDVEVKMFDSGEDLIKFFTNKNEHIDIIFLDIEMNGIDGLRTAEIIREYNQNIPIIFLTNHTEMAMEGYSVNAFRFLAKPVQNDKLYQALASVDKMKHTKDRIELNDGEKSNMVLWEEIQYIESENVYVHVITNHDSYLIRRKISSFEENMPIQFFYRPHRSYLINLNNVRSFDGKRIIMKNGKEIPISRGKGSDFKNKMMKYLNTQG